MMYKFRTLCVQDTVFSGHMFRTLCVQDRVRNLRPDGWCDGVHYKETGFVFVPRNVWFTNCAVELRMEEKKRKIVG